MNLSTFPCALAMLSAATLAEAEPVVEERSWTERHAVTADSPRVQIKNIWGTVRVRAGSANEIVITIDERRSAPDQQLYERSLHLLGLDIAADGEGVSIVVGDPYNGRDSRNPCRKCRVDYQFDVTVPASTTVDVGTVVDGRVEVEGVTGLVSASNVNGPVSIRDLHNCSNVDSVNGEVELDFSVSPVSDCQIETINGDISLSLPASAGLMASLDLFNGRVESEFDVLPIAVTPAVSETRENGKYRYVIKQAAGVQIGAGGPSFSFTSMNGDIRITRNP